MHYRRLGGTDLDVSVICLGTMTFGEQNTESEAHQQLDFAVGEGVNFIDTAELYAIPPRAETYGLTESYVGSWLRQRGKRDDLVLASKAAGPGEFVKHIRGGPRLNRQHLREALEGSLRRLGTDYLDLYQIHWPERSTNFFGRLGYEVGDDSDVVPIEDTLEVLNDFVAEGKVRHIGISNETPWGLMEYLRLAEQHGWPRVETIQNPYSLLNRSFEVGLAEMAHREHVSLLAYSPLGFGVLTGKYLDGQQPAGARLTRFQNYGRYSGEAAVPATAEYCRIARDHDMTPAEMALAFVNSRPWLAANIIGATTLDQLRENVGSIHVTLSEAALEEIEAVHRRYSNPAP